MITTLSRVLRSRRPVLAAAASASLLLMSCKDGASAGKGTANGAPPKAAAAGTPVDFQLTSVDGRKLGPKSFPGQVVVVDFWATWCLPCRFQAQILEPVYRDLKGRGVQFLAANVGETPDDVKKFLKATAVPLSRAARPGPGGRHQNRRLRPSHADGGGQEGEDLLPADRHRRRRHPARAHQEGRGLEAGRAPTRGRPYFPVTADS